MGKHDNLDKWLIKPGTTGKANVGELVGKLIEEYSLTTTAIRSLCLNDNNEAVYFISFPDEDSPMDHADVALFDKDKFVFLPKELAFDLAQSYITHIKIIGEGYDWLAEESK